MTTASTIDLVTRRVRWLEGKNAELRPQLAAVRSETDWALRTYGARPAGIETLISLVNPAAHQWNDLDQRLAAQVGPYAADVRRAVSSLQELETQFEGAERGATPEQMQQLNLLAGRVNTAISEGSRLYNQWITYPSARSDTENVSLSERAFRQWYSQVPAGYIIPRVTGASLHEAWEATGARVSEAAEQEEEVQAQTSVFGQHQTATGATGGVKTGGAPPTGPTQVERTAWSIRDKLAVVGVASIGAVALYTILKVKRAIPFV